MSTLLLIGVLAAVGFGIWRVLRPVLPRTEKGHYGILLQKTGRDTALADRLIEYELRRSPALTREKAIENAIWRLDRDRS
jgi:hypothetical protein